MKMKKRIVLILLFGAVMASVHANPDIVRAFSVGDVQRINSFLDASVDLTIERSGSSTSKMQAQDAISSFFRKHRPSNFSVTHKTEKEKTGLLMGKLYTDSGTFQVLILTAKNGSRESIRQLKIEQSAN